MIRITYHLVVLVLPGPFKDAGTEELHRDPAAGLRLKIWTRD